MTQGYKAKGITWWVERPYFVYTLICPKSVRTLLGQIYTYTKYGSFHTPFIYLFIYSFIWARTWQRNYTDDDFVVDKLQRSINLERTLFSSYPKES